MNIRERMRKGVGHRVGIGGRCRKPRYSGYPVRVTSGLAVRGSQSPSDPCPALQPLPPRSSQPCKWGSLTTRRTGYLTGHSLAATDRCFSIALCVQSTMGALKTRTAQVRSCTHTRWQRGRRLQWGRGREQGFARFPSREPFTVGFAQCPSLDVENLNPDQPVGLVVDANLVLDITAMDWRI